MMSLSLWSTWCYGWDTHEFVSLELFSSSIFFFFILNLDKLPSDLVCILRFFLTFQIWIWDIKR